MSSTSLWQFVQQIAQADLLEEVALPPARIAVVVATDGRRAMLAIQLAGQPVRQPVFELAQMRRAWR